MGVNFIVAALYALLAGAIFGLSPNFVIPFYPAAGLAVAAVFYYGHNVLFGIMSGALVAELLHFHTAGFDLLGPASGVSLAVACGAAAQAALGAALARRWFGAELILDEPRQALGLLLAIGPLSCWVNASLGTVGLLLLGEITQVRAGETWLRWWLGDSNGVFTLGLILLAPKLLGDIKVGMFVGVLSVTALLVAGLQLLTEHYLNQLAHEGFEQRFARLSTVFDNSLTQYRTQLQALAAFMGSREHVTSDEFQRFIGILGVDTKEQPILRWEHRVPAAQRTVFEHRMRLQYWPDFTITELGPDGSVRVAGERSEYLPALYQSRHSSAEQLFGSDMIAEPSHARFIRQVAVHGELVVAAAEDLSAPLLAAATGRRVIAAYHPAYMRDISFESAEVRWQAFLGVAVSLISVDTVLEQLKASLDSRGLQFCWRDVTDPHAIVDYAADTHCPGVAAAGVSASSWQGHRHEVHFGGRTWQIGAGISRYNALAPYQPLLFGVWVASNLFLGGFGALLLLYSRRSFYLERINDALQGRIQVVDHLNLQLQTRERRLREMMDTAPVPVAVLDHTRRPDYLNPEFTMVLGYTLEDFPDAESWWRKIFPDSAYRSTFLAFLRDMSTTARTTQQPAAAQYQAVVTCSGGEEKLVTISLSHTGEFTTLVLADLSERQRRETELQQAKDIAEHASREKSEFLAMMSHEIRTPLHGLLGMLALIEDEGIAPASRMYLQLARSSAESLQLLLDDILDFSKLEGGRLVLEDVAFVVRDLLEGIVALQALHAEQKGIDLSWQVAPEVPRYLRGDALRLRQILQNLVSNAIKFTQSGVVRVDLSAAPLPNNQMRLLLCIQDSGIGMTFEQQQKLFRPFAQADASITRRFGGSGLGLAIVAQLVALMRGQVWCESRIGYGSRFYVSLPLSVPPQDTADETAPEQGLAQSGGSLRILLAEDNEINQILAVGVLRRQGHVVDVATNGRLAVERWLQARFDVILMDVRMPEMDGLSATREIRRLEQAAGTGVHIPIIAMTADAMPEDRVRCLETGMDDYLAKPLRWPELTKLLAQWCSSASKSTRVASTSTAIATPQEAHDPWAHLRNPSQAQALFFDDAELLRETSQSFIEQMEGFRERLRAAVAQGDLNRLREEAHAVKGVVGIFNAQLAKDAAYALECIARNGEMNKVADASETLESQLQTLAEVLRELLAKLLPP